MAQLNRIHGLFQVTDRVYQVRGYDAANLTVVVGDHGYVVIDPLTCVETAAAALQLVRNHLGERPVTAVIHTHCHVDHYGGVKGVVDEVGVRSGDVPLVAPAGFYDHAIEGSIPAGPIMDRRSGYMFGGRLPRGPHGHVGSGIAAGVGTGLSTLIRPSHTINTTGEELVLDGVRFVFQLAQDTEAPAEMNFHLPELRALCMAETVSQQMHNLYTLRGAPVRDARAWSACLDYARGRFVDGSDVLFNCHQWPVWGAKRIVELLTLHSDLYRYIHDETLRLANHGYTPNEIAELIELPESLRRCWATRGNYGSLEHNAKGVYQRYLGWFDGNPASLAPLPPAEAGRRYVEALGGVDAVLNHARTAIEAGDYRWAAELLKHALAVDPDNAAARLSQADAFEQLGYQAESAPWRNIYLVGAQELRHGVPKGRAFRLTSPDVITGLSTQMMIDHIAVRLNGPEAGDVQLRVGLQIIDSPDEEWLLDVRNGVLHSERGFADATVTLHVAHAEFGKLAFGSATLEELIEREAAAVHGARDDLDHLLGLLDTFAGGFDVVSPNLR
jgi:alkyl sulfatase BDS1-like metallo-beta-lactamase superfamily hydrolase